MDIRKIFLIIKRWLWLLILGAVIAGAAGYFVSSRQTPMYRASTRFVILRAASTTYDYYAYLDYQQLVSTYTQLLSTDALLEQVSQEVGFPVYGGASAEQIGESQFINLSVTHQDPQKAAIIANALIKVLIEQNEKLQSVRYETSRQNMQQRAEQALEQMELLQTQINEISDESVQEQLEQAKIQIDELQGQVTDLEINIANISPSLSPEEQSSRRIAYQAELDQIQPILELYQELYTQLTVMGEPIQNENMAFTRVDQLQRTYNLYEQIYLNSISSIEALDLTKVQSTPNVQVELATPPQSPFSPRPNQTAALSAAVGLFLVGGLVFLLEYLDDTLKTPEDVKNVLGLPVIGFVANMDGKGTK
ncbi:MAG: GumC family protein, partial [Anaerolineales bacterium]